jgi:hypothetical protein
MYQRGCRCEPCRQANREAAASFRIGRRQSNAPKDPPGDWAESGNCIGLPSDWFFPNGRQAITEAKAVCASCAVKPECLTYAMATPVEMHGIWGGTDARERRRMRRAS